MRELSRLKFTINYVLLLLGSDIFHSMPDLDPKSTSHFKGKDALGHVIEAQAQGLMAASEIHGTEVPGYLSAAIDAARESCVALTLLWIVFLPLRDISYTLLALLTFSFGWIIWKFGRSAWLGWSRLERLHRILEQERWEITHHREQERAELKELYAAKGFEGKLLEDVLDVLMADDNRLLRVMVEEELGLSLNSHIHPLQQGFGALIGALFACAVCVFSYFLFPPFGILPSAMLIITAGGAISSYSADNKIIPSSVWNLGIAVLAFGGTFFLLQYLWK